MFFFINLLIIFFFWWQGSGTLFDGNAANIFLAVGRICGLLAVYFVLLQFVLRGRAIWIEEVFGLNNLSTVHRLNGYLCLSFISLHVFSILTSYSIITQKNIIDQLVFFITANVNLLQSFLSFLLFFVIVGTSIYIVRRRLRYETWYYTHLMTYLAILFAWGHQLELGGDFINQIFVWYWYALYGFVFINFVLFRYFRQGYLWMKYRFAVESIIRETEDTISIYITGNNLAQFSIKPGQFFILRFLDKKRWWQAHPFSLSFVPKNNTLRITVKNVGDFTSEISSLKKGTPLLLDGPLGVFTKDAAKTGKYLFIAGGVGITPIRAVIEELVQFKKNIVLLYSNKTTDIIFKKELDVLSNKYPFPIVYILTDEPTYKGEKGRIDADKIKRLVPDFIKRDIYLCGPPPMMNALIQILIELGVSKDHIHYEKFDL